MSDNKVRNGLGKGGRGGNGGRGGRGKGNKDGIKTERLEEELPHSSASRGRKKKRISTSDEEKEDNKGIVNDRHDDDADDDAAAALWQADMKNTSVVQDVLSPFREEEDEVKMFATDAVIAAEDDNLMDTDSSTGDQYKEEDEIHAEFVKKGGSVDDINRSIVSESENSNNSDDPSSGETLHSEEEVSDVDQQQYDSEEFDRELEYLNARRKKRKASEVFVKDEEMENMIAELKRSNSCSQSRNSLSSRSLVSALTNSDGFSSTAAEHNSSINISSNGLLLDIQNIVNKCNSTSAAKRKSSRNELLAKRYKKEKRVEENRQQQQNPATSSAVGNNSSSSLCDEIRNKLKQDNSYNNTEGNSSKLIFMDVKLNKEVVAFIMVRTISIGEWLKSGVLPFPIPYYGVNYMLTELRKKFVKSSYAFLEEILKVNSGSQYPFKSFSMLTKFSPNVEPEVFDAVRRQIMKYVSSKPVDEKNEDKVVELDHRVLCASVEELDVIIDCVKKFDVRPRN